MRRSLDDGRRQPVLSAVDGARPLLMHGVRRLPQRRPARLHAGRGAGRAARDGVMAVMAGRASTASRARAMPARRGSSSTLRLQTVLAQWEQDLRAAGQPARAGAALRRRDAAPDAPRRQAACRSWPGRCATVRWRRWAGPPRPRARRAAGHWLPASSCSATSPASCKALEGVSALAGLLLSRQRLDQCAVQRRRGRPSGPPPREQLPARRTRCRLGVLPDGVRPGRHADARRATGTAAERAHVAPTCSAAMPSRPAPRQRGAALLTAMVIVTLVATLAAGHGLAAVARGAGRGGRARAHAVGLDPDRRARLGAADPARGRAHRAALDHLGEPWAVPLAEARAVDLPRGRPTTAPRPTTAASRRSCPAASATRSRATTCATWSMPTTRSPPPS